jgi:histidinol dehydrogenase
MPLRLDNRSGDFAARFSAFLTTKREAAQDVEHTVRDIIGRVRNEGDRALVELSAKFDGIDLSSMGLRVPADEIDAATAACERRALDALRLARDRIETYHRRQRPVDERFTDALGVELGHRWSAIEAVGLYVPGGTAFIRTEEG